MPRDGGSVRALTLTDKGLTATDHVPAFLAEQPNRLGPPVVVRCLSCRDRHGTPQPLADCTCYDHLLPARGAG